MKNEERLVPVTIYCDSTGLFTEEECNTNNFIDMLFPGWIVNEWYKENEKVFAFECEAEGYEANAYNWYMEVYTADDTDGLYDFAVEKGYDPVFDVSANTKDAVTYKDHEGKTVVIFKGDYLECRKWARAHDWKYEYYYTSLETLEEEEKEVDLEMLFG